SRSPDRSLRSAGVHEAAGVTVRALFAAALLVVTSALPAAAAPEELSIRAVDTSDFPRVTLTASVEATRALTPADVTVREDGVERVAELVEPLTKSGGSVDVVLVLDTSGSMEGQPLSSAVAAALRFVTSLPDDIAAGIITFADRPSVLTPITLDRRKLLSALGRVRAQGETALYDAVRKGTAMFEGDGQHNLIVLSDGADTASRATLAQATEGAVRAGVSVFTVGLTTGEFDADSLRRLSRESGGHYAPAATAKLSSVYEDLASELASQYLITYSSARRDGGETEVTLSAQGASDSVLLLTPRVLPPAPRPEEAEAPSPFVTAVSGPAGLVAALGLCFGAVFLLMVMVLGTGARKRRDRELTRRTSASTRAEGDKGEAVSNGWLPGTVADVAERAGRIGGVTGKLEAGLERAGMPLRTGEFLVALVAAAVMGTLMGVLMGRNWFLALLMGAAGGAAPFVWLALAVRRRVARLHGQLADILMILANALRAGHSFMQALDLVAQEVGDPAGEEFGRLVAEVRLGRPVDEALDALAERLGSEDFKWALLAVNIQRDVGGNLAEVLETVSDTIRERDAIRRQVDVLTAEGRLSVWILAGLPVAVAFYLAWVNPEYLALLFNNGLGLLMTIVAGSLLAIGIFWMKKVVKIDV
ncbi:MAG: type II secretion system F family protein, partial [Actinomycetota bacterium]|nr:type II secretion system F family protein [Actinomycetota bacterium]